MRLPKILAALRKAGGPAPKPLATDPFAQVLWENVAYLASDVKRAAAWRRLEEDVGTTPEAILAAKPSALLAAAREGGIFAELRAKRLREAARIASKDADVEADLGRLADLSPPHARKVLCAFPAVGEPIAEKILLFAGAHPFLALDSNGLRTLLRLGYGHAAKGYAASYRSAQAAAAAELPEEVPARREAHALLRRHGQDVCTRKSPACERCPVADLCPSRGTTRGDGVAGM